MKKTLESICKFVNGELIGEGDILIHGISGLEGVGKNELTFAEDQKHLSQALTSPAAAIIVPKEVNHLNGRPGIRVENPKLAFLLLLEHFHPEEAPKAGIHPSVIQGKNVQIGEGVSIQAHVVIGDNVSIGQGCQIASGVAIGDDSAMGENCIIHPNVVIYRQTQIGDRVRIHGGSVIGGDGFGYILHEGRYVKVPQVGNVIIENDVELGCNVCIDRATAGSTVIREGTKLDNLVQIAHNDRVGKHVLISGQAGLAGSITIGDYVVMGGKAGVVDHVTIGKGAKIGAASVVTKSVTSGETVWGYPARPVKETKRRTALVGRLGRLFQRVKDLVERVAQNEARIKKLEEKRS